MWPEEPSYARERLARTRVRSEIRERGGPCGGSASLSTLSPPSGYRREPIRTSRATSVRP
jgi:hypothetical protein